MKSAAIKAILFNLLVNTEVGNLRNIFLFDNYITGSVEHSLIFLKS